MTRNHKIAAAVIGSLALIVGIGAYELNKGHDQAVTTTRTATETVPIQPSPVLGAHVAPATVQPTPNPGATPANPDNRVAATAGKPIQGVGPVTRNSATDVRNPYGAPAPSYLPSSPYAAGTPINQLHAEQAVMAPAATETTVQTRPTTSVYSQRTTAYVPESSTTMHRVYVHRRVHYSHKSGKIHVSRAVKHTVLFAVKMPGRLRL
jgi:hypothetical protein